MTTNIPSELFSDGRWRRMKALMRKEAFQIFRDPSSFIITVVLPMLLLFLYGFGVSLDLDHLRIGLVMEDTAPDAQSFAKSLIDSKYFEVKIARDRRELNEDITKGAIRGIVVIPSYFSDFRNRPATIAPIQVIADGSEPNTANFVQNYVQGAFWNWLLQEAISDDLTGLARINIDARYWFNEELESRYFLLSGSLAIIMTLIGTLLTAMVVAREWERGTMEALMSTPVKISEIIWSKFIAYFVLGMISMMICVVVSVFGYGLPLRGSLWLLLLVSGAFLFSALGTGLLISTYAKNQFVASQLASILGFLPSYMLSGFLFEIGSMPAFVRALTHIIPARYFVQCLQTLFLVGNVWSLVLFNMIPMLGIGFILIFITMRKTVKRLD
jgi:ABC-2 type transport system permease protein